MGIKSHRWVEDEDEEEFPQKCSRSSDRAHQQLRHRTLNKLSKKFGEQLKVAFESTRTPDTPACNLHNIYNAKSLSSGPVQHPISISQLERWRATPHYTIESNTGQHPPNFDPDEDIDHESKRMVCFGVSMEKLSTTQEVRDGPDYYHGWMDRVKNVLTLRPLTKSIQLTFDGVRKFEKEVNNLIADHWDRNVSKLYTKNVSSASTTGKYNVNANAFRYEFMHQANQAYPYTPSRIMFDEEDHTILLIPTFTKSGFTSFDIKETVTFPFHVEFEVDGQQLIHDFQLPLTPSHQPQRFRLKFIFRRPDYNCDEEISVFSSFTVFSIIPCLPTPTTSATIQVLEDSRRNGTADPAADDTETNRFVKTVLGNNGNKKYLPRGDYIAQGLRCRSVRVETVSADGFKVGYNFRYETSPRPTYSPDKARRRPNTKRKDLVDKIRADFRDCRN